MPRKIYGLLVFGAFLFLSLTSQAQTLPSNVNAIRVDVIALNEESGSLYPNDKYDGLNISFELSQVADVKRVCIELNSTNNPNEAYKRYYSAADLISMNFINENQVNIPFGNIKKTESYTIKILVEDVNGFNSQPLSIAV